MKRRHPILSGFLKTTLLFAGTILSVSLFSACNKQEEKKQPNIIFLFADDQCYSTVHALGNEEIITPNLDKMVEGGVTFTHTFNMGSWTGAVCASSRAMLNTGRSVWRAFDYQTHQQDLVKKGQMWAQLMQSAGYETYMTGKWHVKTPAETIFDHTIHIRPGMPHDAWAQTNINKLISEANGDDKIIDALMPVGYNRPLSATDTIWKSYDKSYGGYWEGGKHWSEVLREDAINFIETAKEKDKPFFMYLAFNAPHDPRQAPKEYLDMYPLENISVPESFLPLYPYMDSIGCGRSLRDAALAPFPRTEYAVKKHRQEYYALITHLDHQIGEILKALKASGKMENTYIFYTADHGLALGNHGLIGKQNMYDHSMRPPLFVIGPDIPKGKKVDADIYLQDIMASAIDLAGLQKPEYIEFNSLLPLARGEQTKSNYEAIYGCYKKDLQRMIRKDNFKLIVYPHGKTMLLYDLKNDPQEMNDLAKDPKYQDKKMKLFNDLLELQKAMDDPLDLKQVFAEM